MKILLCIIAMLLPLATIYAAGGPAASEKTLELKTPTGTLKGTLLQELKAQPQTVVLLIAGSGPTDKNGNNPMMKNNHLKLLAEALAAQGIASLRYDKRGIGENQPAGGEEKDLRFDDLVADAAAWITELKKDKRFRKVVVLGHSEGALIGMLAAQKAGADAYLSVAGAGQSADKIIREQLKDQPAQITAEISPILEALTQGKPVPNVNPMFAALFRESVQPYLISWFKYDPATEISKLTMPVLIVQGTTDLQVTERDARLLAAANPKGKLVLVPGMNHILKTAPADPQANMATYNNPDLPLEPVFTKAVVTFIQSLK